MTKRRLLVLSHYSSATGDGIHDKHWRIAHALREFGWDTDIVCSADHHWLQGRIDLGGRSYASRQDGGVRAFYLKSRPYRGNGAGRALNMAEFVGRALVLPPAARGADVVMASLPHSFVALDLLAWKLARPGLPIVTEVRDIWSGYLGPYMGMSRLHPFHMAVSASEKLCLRLSRGLVSSLPKADRWAASLGCDLPFHMLPFGVQLPPEEPCPLPEGVVPDAFRGRFVVGYVGGLIKHNHLEPLLDAARELRDDPRFGFLIVGAGSYEEELRRHAADLENVHFAGKVRKEHVPSVLARLDLCYKGTPDIGVNEYGTSPIKMIEYMASARPVVHVTNESEELVAQSGCGWILPLDRSGELSSLLRTIDAIPLAERIQKGEAGREHIVARMSYPTIAREFDQFLRRILA